MSQSPWVTLRIVQNWPEGPQIDSAYFLFMCRIDLKALRSIPHIFPHVRNRSKSKSNVRNRPGPVVGNYCKSLRFRQIALFLRSFKWLSLHSSYHDFIAIIICWSVLIFLYSDSSSSPAAASIWCATKCLCLARTGQTCQTLSLWSARDSEYLAMLHS